MALQSDGRVVVAGNFGTFAGQPRNNIARLESNGALDTAYNPDVTGGSSWAVPVTRVRLQTDGKLVIGGDFTSVGAMPRSNIARLEPNGAVDASFSPDADDRVIGLDIDSNGKILVAGWFTVIGGAPRNAIARLNSNGGVDTSFDPGRGLLDGSGYPGFATCVVSQADGRVVVGGSFRVADDAYRYGMARFNQDGSVDSLPGPDYHVDALTLLPDGHIIAGGRFGYIGNARRGRVARLNPDFSLDSSFDPGAGVYGLGFGSFTFPRGIVSCTAVQGDGKLILGGSFDTVDNAPRVSLARLNPDGSLDAGFNPILGGFSSNYSFVHSIAVQLDGKILIAGTFKEVNGQPREYIARLNADGTLDASFQPVVDDEVRDIKVLPSGSILIVGRFTTVDYQARSGMARLTTGGVLDGSFNPLISRMYGDPYVWDCEVQQDGAVVILGDFTQVNGVARAGMARLASNGVLDATFDPVTVSDGYVSDLAIQPDGRILISGSFRQVDGLARRYVARLESDGSLDSAFTSNATGQIMLGEEYSSGVWTILVEPTGGILIGGRFRTVGGDRFYNLARLNTDGTLSRTPPSLGSSSGGDSSGGCVAGTGALPGALFLLVVYAARRRRTQLA